MYLMTVEISLCRPSLAGLPALRGKSNVNPCFYNNFSIRGGLFKA